MLVRYTGYEIICPSIALLETAPQTMWGTYGRRLTRAAFVFEDIDLMKYATYNSEQKVDISRKTIHVFKSFNQIILVSDIEVSVSETIKVELEPLKKYHFCVLDLDS